MNFDYGNHTQFEVGIPKSGLNSIKADRDILNTICEAKKERDMVIYILQGAQQQNFQPRNIASK